MAEFRRVDANLQAFFQHIAANQPEGEVCRAPGLSIANSASVFQMFNAAFLSSPVPTDVSDLESRLEAAAHFFRERDLGWSCWVCDDFLPPEAWAQSWGAFARFNLVKSAQMPGMITGELLPARRPLPELSFHTVFTQATRKQFCAVTSTAFQLPFSWCRAMYGHAGVWKKDLYGVVAMKGDEPVGCGAVFHGAGALGLYCLATLPAFEGRGYGEAVTRHAIAVAQQRFGTAPLVLQATPSGLPLYLRLGYQEVTRFTVFASQRVP
jgi:ribosomal protein S18 acetylase RimI-like enzyme